MILNYLLSQNHNFKEVISDLANDQCVLIWQFILFYAIIDVLDAVALNNQLVNFPIKVFHKLTIFWLKCGILISQLLLKRGYLFVFQILYLYAELAVLVLEPMQFLIKLFLQLNFFLDLGCEPTLPRHRLNILNSCQWQL